MLNYMFRCIEMDVLVGYFSSIGNSLSLLYKLFNGSISFDNLSSVGWSSLVL